MHQPVLLNQVVEYLNAKKGGKFVDATAGGGGHVRAIAEANTDNEILAIDLDQTSLDKLTEQLVLEGLNQNIKTVWGSYKNIDTILAEAEWGKADGVLLDLGFSSLQLDDANRGFSFATDGPLDMRYDTLSKLTADEVVNRYQPDQLQRILSDFGEEKFSKKIVSKIIEARKKNHIKTTRELSEIIRSAVPLPVRFKASDSIRRVFQALRIEVNSELENLKIALPKMLKSLNPGGRLVVISFHSLEDRIVKEFYTAEAKDCVCPPEFPTCICDKVSSVKILTRKPIVADEDEIKNNSRSKSAKLRVVEKN